MKPLRFSLRDIQGFQQEEWFAGVQVKDKE